MSTALTRWPRVVVLLGLTSLLNDVASEMVVPVLPAFVATLGGGGLALGLIDGLAELVAALLKGWSGRASDRLGASRPFVLGGYTLAAVARPFLAVASAPWHVVAVRVADRVGKGLRSAPRDALLAGAVPEAERGAAFGFHRRLDHTGAMLGPLVTLALLTSWTSDPRWIFVASAVPGLLSLLAVWAIAEVPRAPVVTAPPAFGWRSLVAAGPFALAAAANVSDLFLVARVITSPAAPVYAAPLLWVALHLVRQGVAGRAGALADRLPATHVVAAGWVLRAAAAAALALTVEPGAAALGVVAYGLGAASEAAERKVVAARWASHGQGSAFGAYHLASGLAAMVGVVTFGAVWDGVSPAAAFAAAAVGSLAAAGWVATARGASAPG